MNRRTKSWVNQTVRVARLIPDQRVQTGVRIYDIVNKSYSRKGRA